MGKKFDPKAAARNFITSRDLQEEVETQVETLTPDLEPATARTNEDESSVVAPPLVSSTATTSPKKTTTTTKKEKPIVSESLPPEKEKRILISLQIPESLDLRLTRYILEQKMQRIKINKTQLIGEALKKYLDDIGA